MALDDDGWLYRLGLEVELGISKKREREVLAYILDADNGFVVYELDGERLRLVEDTSSVASSDTSSDSNPSSDSSDSKNAIDSSPSPKRTYNLSEKALNQRKRAQAQRKQTTKSTETDNEINNEINESDNGINEINNGINEIEQRNGGIIGGNNNLVSIDNIESIEYIDNDSTSKEIKAQKQKKANSEKFTRELKAVFGEYYKARTNSEFYWDAKQMAHIAKISAQLTAGMREKGIEPTSESVSANFRALLGSIRNQWILDNLSPAIISSKFNEIRMQYARNTSTHTAGVASLDSGYDALRRAFAAGLIPDTGTA